MASEDRGKPDWFEDYPAPEDVGWREAAKALIDGADGFALYAVNVNPDDPEDPNYQGMVAVHGNDELEGARESLTHHVLDEVSELAPIINLLRG